MHGSPVIELASNRRLNDRLAAFRAG